MTTERIHRSVLLECLEITEEDVEKLKRLNTSPSHLNEVELCGIQDFLTILHLGSQVVGESILDNLVDDVRIFREVKYI